MYMPGNCKDIPICECSDYSVHELFKKSREDIINGTDNHGMKNIISMKGAKYDQLNEHGRELVETCVDFLISDKNTFDGKPQRPGKYIALWSFIYQCMNIPANSGY